MAQNNIKAEASDNISQHIPLFAHEANVPTLHLVRTPRFIRLLSRIMLICFFLAPVAMIFVPWQQTLTGSGKVIAFDPVDRPQTITSPIKGLLKQWYVEEGSVVKAGQLLVELRDNDPMILTRLESQLRSFQDKVNYAQAKVKELRAQVDFTVASKGSALATQDAYIAEAEQNVLAAKRDLQNVQAVLDQAKLDYQRQKQLNEHELKLASDLTAQKAEQKYKSSLAKVETAKAKVSAAEKKLSAAIASKEKTANEMDAKIKYSIASLESSKGDVASYEKDLSQLETKLAQQRVMNRIEAPCDGIVFRIYANASEGGSYVKEGEKLAEFVPTTGDRVVELYIKGNDAPLIPALIHSRELEGHGKDPVYVRLMFEGWPAVQFAGWPSVAVGTFGGKVKLVDATDDGEGRFRILVEPDPNDIPWPDQKYLRQGVRAKGWVLLNRVPLGYEVWRRLNAFPPVVAPKPPKESDGVVKMKGKGK